MADFKLPVLSVRKQAQDLDIPQFFWKDVSDKQEVGGGSFGCVYYGKYNGRDIVVKRLRSGERESKKIFLKEARILNKVKNHDKIVEFIAFCNDPYAIMLEYLCFDFRPFGIDKKCSSLGNLLQFLDEQSDFTSFEKLPLQISHDISEGLSFLHGKGIAHRDLKPENILVTNQHYAGIVDDADRVKEIFNDLPVRAKLVDFGESKDANIQTQSLLTSRTHRVDRGTPVFIAPEFHCGFVANATLEELKRADIWAFGLLMYCLLNPEIDAPYLNDIVSAGLQQSVESLKQLLRRKQLPQHGKKYEIHRIREWSTLNKTFKTCAQFDPKMRPIASELNALLQKHPPEANLILTNLSVSQSTALENADLSHALEIGNATTVSRCAFPTTPINDGTNACVFLCIAICDRLLSMDSSSLDWKDIKALAEETTQNLPVTINSLRDVAKMYEPIGAYSIMKDEKTVGDCEFSEEFLEGNLALSESGREELINAILSKSKSVTSSYGVYTCPPVTFLIGCHDDRLFLLDTHAIGQELGGNGSGLLIQTKDLSIDSCVSLVEWIIERLVLSGVLKSNQHSLAWVTRASRGM